MVDKLTLEIRRVTISFPGPNTESSLMRKQLLINLIILANHFLGAELISSK